MIWGLGEDTYEDVYKCGWHKYFWENSQNSRAEMVLGFEVRATAGGGGWGAMRRGRNPPSERLLPTVLELMGPELKSLGFHSPLPGPRVGLWVCIPVSLCGVYMPVCTNALVCISVCA